MNPYSEISNTCRKQVSPACEAIQAAFLQLYKKKDIMRISVKELCEKAHTSRTSFYTNYNNTDELLAEIEDGLIYDLLKVNDRSKESGNLDEDSSRYMGNMLEFVVNHHTALTILLVEQPDIRLFNKWKKAVKFHFWDYVKDEAEIGRELVLEMIASMSIGAYTYLLKHPDTFDSAKVYRMLNAALRSLEY